MSNRFDIMTPRKSRDGKTFWTRIGAAWQGDKGIQLVFDALPLPDAEGRCVANLFEPKGRDAAPQQQPRPPALNGQRGHDLDDDVPY